MTDPRRYLIRMIIFLAIVASIAALLWVPLHGAFMGNPALNGVILGALLLGIVYVIRQTLRLSPEQRWLVGVQKNGKLKQPNAKPVLLATVYAMLADQNQGEHLSALSLRSVLDGVAARLDEGREISRYMIGLLVFLGLLGTFWGLLQTIGAVGLVVGSLDADSNNFSTMMSQLRNGLEHPCQVWRRLFRPRCSDWPARWYSAFSICNWVRRWGGFSTSLKTGCLLSPSSMRAVQGPIASAVARWPQE